LFLFSLFFRSFERLAALA
jgi:hypothetical protein